MIVAVPENLTWPKSLCLRITRACNANCSFCQAPDLHDRISWNVEEIRRLCGIMADAGVVSLKLSGGEPTVRNDLPQIIRSAATSGLTVTVISNGIRLRDDVLQTLRECGGKLKFSVHFGDERNDEVLGNHCFSKVVQNATRTVALGVPLGFNSVVYRENISAMGSVASLALKLGASKVTYFPVVSRGAAVNVDFREELSAAFRGSVESEGEMLSVRFPELKIRVVDIAKEDYWIIDHDGTLFVSGGIESEDRILFEGKRWAIHDE